jgi:glycosyltransferase involved in cell wall biosynthesis
MRHILNIIGDGSPGGGTTVVLELSRGLVRRGFTVTIASQRDSYIIREALRSDIQVLELNFCKRRSSVSLALALGRYIRQNGIMLAHAHGARAALPLALLPLSWRSRFVYTVHGFHYPAKRAGIRNLARHAESFCISRAAMTVFVSRHDRELAIEDNTLQLACASKVIYNGAHVSEPLATIDDEKSFDIAFLGRLHAQKDPLIIPEILLVLRPARPTVAIIGNGPCERELRARVARAGLDAQVTFFGECAHAHGLAILSQARVLLLPSLFEGLPLAVIEAMHMAIPAVVSRVGGVPELVDDGRTGLLIKPKDVESFAEGLRTLLSDPDARRRMGWRAKERARTEFSLDRNIAEHVGVYMDLLQQRPNSADIRDVA